MTLTHTQPNKQVQGCAALTHAVGHRQLLSCLTLWTSFTASMKEMLQEGPTQGLTHSENATHQCDHQLQGEVLSPGPAFWRL